MNGKRVLRHFYRIQQLRLTEIQQLKMLIHCLPIALYATLPL
jgi:hypothetical protein